MCQTRQEIEEALGRLVHDLDPEALHGSDAKVLVGFFSRLEHLAAAGKALCARRVSQTGAFETDGHRHAGEWLAQQTGDSIGSALSVLEAAAQVQALPEVEEAFRSGELSPAQVKEVAGAAVVDPGAAAELLDAARSENLETLKRRAARVKAARASAEDEAAHARRLHATRRLRSFTGDDGAFHLEARLTPEAGALMLARLRAEADAIFASARRAGVRESSQAYLADALVALVTRTEVTEADRPKFLAHLRVDLAALRRGNTGPGELCEVAGVGPVWVATARELLGDSLAKLLVTSGTDVHTICNLGRSVPAKVNSALIERDERCVVPGCGATYNLERDHRVIPFVAGGPTELDNLARICHHHHFLKTHEGYALEGGPGAWVWVHPDGRRDGPGPLRPPPRKPPPAGHRLHAGGEETEHDPPASAEPASAEQSLFATA